MAGRWQCIVDDGDLKVGVTTSRRDCTTSTVVVTGGGALLVDPAWEPDELDWLAADLAAAGIRVAAGFATHAHHDHVLWHPGFGDAPRFASPQVARAAAAERAQLVAALGSDWPAGLGDLVGRLRPVDSVVIRSVEVIPITHNAHAAGHTALWLPGPRVLIAGDMLSDIELPLLEQSTPADYAAGLTALRPFVEQATAVIPGHGSPAIGQPAATGRWVADQRYLDLLQRPEPPADGRLGLPGMAQAHRENREQATGRAT